MPEYAPTVDRSTVASLERLLQNSDALIDAHRSQSAAIGRSPAPNAPNVAAAAEGGGVASRLRSPIPSNAAMGLGALGVIGLGASIVGEAARIPGFVQDVRSGEFGRRLQPNQANVDRMLAESRASLAGNQQLNDFAAPLRCRLFGRDCDNSVDGVPFSGDRAPLPPFYGGQGGVGYFYTVQYEGNYGGSTPNWQSQTRSNSGSFAVLGPISGLALRDGGASLWLTTSSGDDRLIDSIGSPGETRFRSYRITSLTRSDGQPDTAGNPAPMPGADLMPITPPSVGNPVDGAGRPNQQRNREQAAPPTIAPAPNPTNPATQPNRTDPRSTPQHPTDVPANPPDNDDNENNSPVSPNNLLPNLPFLPPVVGRVGTPRSPSATGTRTTSVPSSTSTGTQNSPTCFYDNRNIKGDVADANTKLIAMNTYLEATIYGKLLSIDNKLGPQIPNGGISGTLGKVFDFAKKTWDFLQIDRILSVLTFVSVLHNAYMLSNALTQTLFSAFSNILDATGLDEFLGLVDSDDEEVNVGELVGKLADNFFKGIFGVETVDGIKSTWKKWNRIYQAATNILNSIQSMVFSMVEILETISNYTGRIGNALRKSGTVLQNAFNWMNPNANYQDGRFFRYLNNIQETVEVIDQIASEVVSIQDTAEELFDQKEEFNKAVEDAETAVSNTESASKTASTPNVTITPQDERRAET
jgi:hypothetical protein